MPTHWDKLDLEGAGLQAVNRTLVRRMKRTARAYAWWCLFPLGAHRLYLEDRLGAAIVSALTAVAVILWVADLREAALAAAGVLAAFAVFDLWWIPRRVVRVNKALRMALYLGAGADPPPGYQGRTFEPEPTSPHHGSKRIPSFSEQERLLRELSRQRKDS